MLNKSIITVAFAVLVLFVVSARSFASPRVETVNVAVRWTNPDTGKMSAITINAEQVKAIQALCKSGMDEAKALEHVIRNTQKNHFIASQVAKNTGPMAKDIAKL